MLPNKNQPSPHMTSQPTWEDGSITSLYPYQRSTKGNAFRLAFMKTFSWNWPITNTMSLAHLRVLCHMFRALRTRWRLSGTSKRRPQGTMAVTLKGDPVATEVNPQTNPTAKGHPNRGQMTSWKIIHPVDISKRPHSQTSAITATRWVIRHSTVLQ